MNDSEQAILEMAWKVKRNSKYFLVMDQNTGLLDQSELLPY